MLRINNTSELLQMLQKNKVVIYGAGYVAVRFFQAIKKHDLTDNVLCFVTTSGSNKALEGLDVKNIHEIKEFKDVPVCIAVHESIRDEIAEGLQKEGFIKYVWIYPFMNELMFGTPVQGVRIPLKDIWAMNRENFAIAARYLVIENYYTKGGNGNELYKKSMALYSDEKTAEKRLRKFIELITNWDLEGYQKNNSIMLLENGCIIDGLHRIALAIYHKQDDIVCDVFPTPDDGKGIHEQTVSLTKDSLLEAQFKDIEIRELERVNGLISEWFDKGNRV